MPNLVFILVQKKAGAGKANAGRQQNPREEEKKQVTAEHVGPPGRQTGHEIHFQDKTESKFESDVGLDKERASDNKPFVPKKALL